LISNDVNVRLVFDLSKKIQERALNEKTPPGLTLREHVVRVVYEELQQILGEKYEARLEKQKILVCGLFGSGKCVHPNTLIPLADGSVKTIKELYDSSDSPEAILEDGFSKDSESLRVFSFDSRTLKVIATKPSALWKLKKTESLYKVTIDNGSKDSISTTPEHPFFVLENGAIIKKRADALKLGDFVAVPKFLPYEEREVHLRVLDVLPATCKIINPVLARSVALFVKHSFGTLEKGIIDLGVSRSYSRLTAELKKGEVDASLLKMCMKLGLECEVPSEYLLKGFGHKTLRFPAMLTAELSEFMGYVYGDGNIDCGSIHVTNADLEIADRLSELGDILFRFKPRVLEDKRSKGLKRISFSSKLLSLIVSKLFGLPQARKSSSMSLPSFMLSAPKNTTAKFLQAYFDCDGHATNGSRHIEFATASKLFAFQLRLLLLKNGIASSYSIKLVNNTPYYRVYLHGENCELFAGLISSKISYKSSSLNSFSSIGARQTKGKLENLYVGAVISDARNYFGASIGDVQKHVSSYGIYESEGVISKNALRKFIDSLEHTRNFNNSLLGACVLPTTKAQLLEKFNLNYGILNASIYRLQQQGFIVAQEGVVRTTVEGKAFLEKNASFEMEKIEFLKRLYSADLSWAKVKRIELDESTEYVYDLTVDEHHNFVANNFFVHNTTSIGKLAKYYQGKGLKTAVVAGDVHRPAAFDQLKQLSEQVKSGFYGVKGEKDAVKIARDSLIALKDYDVLIFDSAGRSGFDEELVSELKQVNAVLVPDEKFLVVSADLGQVAGKQAQEFNKAVGLTGVIITKMDGSGKGGGALSSVAVSGARVAFIGTGEKMSDVQLFNPESFVGQLVGFPDLPSLLEKAKEISDEKALEDAMASGKLDFTSFLVQMRAMRKMGPLKQVLQMLGLYDVPEEFVSQSEEKFKSFESMVLSMTKAERENPDLMKSIERQARVAKGSGYKEDDVRELVRNFEKIKKMMKQVKGNKGLLKRFSKGMPGLSGFK
ncbi:MAG: LAGLIDADG family homing endonuclease, partial [Candidatus Micrarchaeota archaeon]